MEYNKFVDFYKKYGRCINQINKPKHILSEKELLTKYEKYCSIQNKEKNTIDEKWIQVRNFITERDKSCRFLTKLRKENPVAYSKVIKDNNPYLLQILDPAHIISRAESKNLYYEPENIILLSRPIHSSLDSYHDPITGKPITRQERENWFRYIVGDELFDKLLKLK